MEWLKIIGRWDLKEKLVENKQRYAYRICEDHFETRFIRTTKPNCKSLFENAVPTLNLESKSQDVKTESRSSSESHIDKNHSSEDSRSPCENVIIKCENLAEAEDGFNQEQNECREEYKPNNSQNDLYRDNKRDFMQLCKSFLNKGLTQLIQWQIYQTDENKDAFNLFALDLYIRNPEAYKFFRSTFHLPAFDTLQRTIIPKSTNIDAKTLRVLKLKVDRMSSQEKICSICVKYEPVHQNLFYDIKNDKVIGFDDLDGTQRAEPANYTVVIMVCGIIHKWKQPIAHAFLSDSENQVESPMWVYEIISLLLDIGLDIRTYVTNKETRFTFSPMASPDNNDTGYFEINGRKIYHIFDIRYLMDRLARTFQTCHFVYGNKIAKWSDIKMETQNENTELKTSSKLKNKKSKKDVQLPKFYKATEVFNNSVALAIKTRVELEGKNSVPLDTAQFVTKMSLLYRILNSSSPQSFTSNNTRLSFLKRMLPLFQYIAVLESKKKKDVTEQIPFVQWFQESLKSILQLIDDLKSADTTVLCTKRLTLNALDNFFSNIKPIKDQHLPTCRQVAKAFKKSFVCNLLKKQNATNCNNDFISLLTKQENGLNFSNSTETSKEENVVIRVGTRGHRLDVPEHRGLVYVSVCLFKLCIVEHKCVYIMAHLHSEQAICSIVMTNVQMVPPTVFIDMVKALDAKFCEFFKRKSFKNIGNEVLKYLGECSLELPCPCFPIDYLKKILVRLKIYNTVRRYNLLVKYSARRLKPLSFAPF